VSEESDYDLQDLKRKEKAITPSEYYLSSGAHEIFNNYDSMRGGCKLMVCYV
jgi:hypothetical protein